MNEPMLLAPKDPTEIIKTADFPLASTLARMPDDTNLWPAQLLSELRKQSPFMGQHDLSTVMDRVDAEAGYGLGYFMVRNASSLYQPEIDVTKEASNRLKIPFVIEDRYLQPFHVFELGGEFYPLTEQRIEQAMINPSLADGVVDSAPDSKSLSAQLEPPFHSRTGGWGRTGTESVAKTAASGVGHVLIGTGLGLLGSGSMKQVSGHMANQIAPQGMKEKAEGIARSFAVPVGTILALLVYFRQNPMASPAFIRLVRKITKLDQIKAIQLADALKSLAPIGAGAAGAVGVGAASGLGSHLFQKKEKTASLTRQLAGTVRRTDFDRFDKEASDLDVREMIQESDSVFSSLQRLALGIRDGSALLKEAATYEELPSVDVLQIRPEGYDFAVKFAAAPAVAKGETKVSRAEASRTLPPEMIEQADQQGVATLSSVPGAQPDPMEENVQPVNGFGLYKVQDSQGQQVVGYVIPNLIDPTTGGPSGFYLFTNGNSHALMDTPPLGVLVGVNFNLPAADMIRGLGIFWKSNGKGLVATTPFSIITEVIAEGRRYYAAADLQGNQIQIVMSPGLTRPVALSPMELAIPEDYEFMQLNNPIELMSSGTADPMLAAKQASAGSLATIRVWEGGVDLSGPVFEKVGSGTHTIEDGLFWLACAGLGQADALTWMNKAASQGGKLDLYGLVPLRLPSETIQSAKEAAAEKLAAVRVPEKHNLLREALVFEKVAGGMVDSQAVDTVLAINFLNPENVSLFTENLPLLHETSSKLAALVYATQLGLNHVPKVAAVRAMHAMEKVIEGLKSINPPKL